MWRYVEGGKEMFYSPMIGSQYVTMDCELLWYKKDIWPLSMVLNKDLLKPLEFPM